ncbi:hypothetical protein HaLaN_28843, partial [Haematococcus lacustris]
MKFAKVLSRVASEIPVRSST